MSEKLTEEIKTVVTEDTKEKLVALAVLHGMKPGEYLRLLVEKEIYGVLHVTQMGLGNQFSTAKARLKEAYGV